MGGEGAQPLLQLLLQVLLLPHHLPGQLAQAVALQLGGLLLAVAEPVPQAAHRVLDQQGGFLPALAQLVGYAALQPPQLACQLAFQLVQLPPQLPLVVPPPAVGRNHSQ